MLQTSGLVLALLSACFSVIQGSPTLIPRDDPENSGPASPKANNTKVVSYTANFDDLPAIIDPRSQVPTPYAGLNYSLWFVEEYSGSMQPASGSKYAISYDYRQPREISTSYTGSRSQSFDLQSLYYACSRGVPQPECNILITGYKARAPLRSYGSQPPQQTVTKTVTYPPLTPPVDPATIVMREAVFGPEWTGLEKVTFTVLNKPEYAGLVIDQVCYQVVEC